MSKSKSKPKLSKVKAVVKSTQIVQRSVAANTVPNNKVSATIKSGDAPKTISKQEFLATLEKVSRPNSVTLD